MEKLCDDYKKLKHDWKSETEVREAEDVRKRLVGLIGQPQIQIGREPGHTTDDTTTLAKGRAVSIIITPSIHIQAKTWGVWTLNVGFSVFDR